MAFHYWHVGNGAGPHQQKVGKIVIHTTEGSSIEGAVAAYRAHNSWPHMTVDFRYGVAHRICQHLPYDVSARALKNIAGGVPTNTAGAIQIEVVGFAQQPDNIDWASLGAEVVGPMAAELGVPVTSDVVWVSYPASYGVQAKQRLSGADWMAYRGVLGHQHVPENSHGDPGGIPIGTMLSAAGPTPKDDDMPLDSTDLNAVRSVMREELLNFQRLPVIWAAESRPTYWYVVWSPFKTLVDQTQAGSLVDNGLAEWSGTTADNPGGLGQAAVVPDHVLAPFTTVGADEYPS